MAEIKELGLTLCCQNPGCQSPINKDESILELLSDTDAVLRYSCECGHESCLSLKVKSVFYGDSEIQDEDARRCFTKVSGVTFSNADGVNRQDLLRQLKSGDRLRIVPGEIDGNRAFFVECPGVGIVGTIRRDLVWDFSASHGHGCVGAKVLQLTGGNPDKPVIGCNIELYIIDGEQKPPVNQLSNSPKDVKHKVYMDPGGRNIYHFKPHCSGMSGAKTVTLGYARGALRARPCKRCVLPPRARNGIDNNPFVKEEGVL